MKVLLWVWHMICVLMVFLFCLSLSLHLLYNFMSVLLTNKRSICIEMRFAVSLLNDCLETDFVISNVLSQIFQWDSGKIFSPGIYPADSDIPLVCDALSLEFHRVCRLANDRLTVNKSVWGENDQHEAYWEWLLHDGRDFHYTYTFISNIAEKKKHTLCWKDSKAK